MNTAIWLSLAASALALCACQNLNLDPESHRDFAKASAAQSMPPADLSSAAVETPYAAAR
jgi:hypothetical protein